MKQSLVIVLLILSAGCLFAQKTITHNDYAWLGDFTTAKFNSKWSLYLDFGLRRSNWVSRWSQLLIRPGLTYHINANVSATAGVAYFSHYSASYVRPEGRGWQQLLFAETYGRMKVGHRLRAEQRFFQRVSEGSLTGGYNYNNRFRYQLALQFPLNKSKLEDRTIYLTIADEILINSGKEIKTNYFDQNRCSAGFGYKWSETLNVQLTFMKNFIQRGGLDRFDDNNVLIINLYHNFDLKKRKE